jgi:hypothetical protein
LFFEKGTLMNFAPVLLTVFLAFQIQPTFAEEKAGTHEDYLASVATYKPMAGFNQVVGPTRFVGYFLRVPDMCRVTVFKAAADDEALIVPPERVEIDIAAAGRTELAVGDGSALAIACTVDADLIKIAPQRPARVADTPRTY